MLENQDLSVTIIGVTIFLLFVVLGVIIYRKVMFPIPKRDSIIKKNYFLKYRYEYIQNMIISDAKDIANLSESISALNFQPITEEHDLWHLKNGSDEYIIHLNFQKDTLLMTLFADSIFSMTRIKLVLDQILFGDQNGSLVFPTDSLMRT
ncbi:MAG: hypothetical protein ACFFDN_45620 [Candidatus Hodarchaeota archaeon]